MCMTFLSLSHAPRFAVLVKCLIEFQFLFGFSVLHMFPLSSFWFLWETALLLPVVLGSYHVMPSSGMVG